MNRAEARYEKRRDVVEAVTIGGEPVVLVARINNLPRRTIFAWLVRYRNGGWDALKEGSRAGRPRKLTGEDMQWLYDAITLKAPRHYQHEFCLWTLATIRTLIKRELRVKLSRRETGKRSPRM